MNDKSNQNLCLRCEKYNINCLYGDDTYSIECSDFIERNERSLKIQDNMVPLTIDSIRISEHTAQRVVLLKERKGNRYLPCWVGPGEADFIAVILQKVRVPRPLPHDFLCSIVAALGATIKYVIICNLKDDVYYAKTILDNGSNFIEIDCRPCDALAVAVRTGVPIFANEEVLNKAAVTNV